MAVTYPVLYKGREYRTETPNPFVPYMAKNGFSGYCGKWLVTGDRLFLISLYNSDYPEFDMENGYKNLMKVFPNCPMVFADWYSGRLSIIDEYEVGDNDELFDIIFTIDKGYVISVERKFDCYDLPF